MPKRLACALLSMLAMSAAAVGAAAPPLRYQLAPGTVRVGFRAYGLGMLPIDGMFTRFTGTLSLVPADPSFCALDLQADAASLRMPADSMTADALSPELLDVTRFPEFKVAGRCQDGRLAATLLLHGVSKPVSMTVTRDGAAWTATGTIRRAEWGMGARPMLAGPDVRVSLVAGLPKDAR